MYFHYNDTLQPVTTSKENACRIICTGTLETGGMARPFPLCPFKRVSTGWRCLFIIRVQEQAIFWGTKVFAEFPKTCPKSFVCKVCLQISPHKDHFGVTSKKGLHVFLCKLWAPFSEAKQCWAPFLPGYSGLLPRFSANQNFLGYACNPCTPISNTTAFHNSIIGNFKVDQDRIETNLLQLFRHPKNSE